MGQAGVNMNHDCGCSTHWDDDLNHPIYTEACPTHRRLAGEWLVPEPKQEKVPVGR